MCCVAVGAAADAGRACAGVFVNMQFLTPERATLSYEMPLAEVVTDFFDELKSRSKGYASMEYQPLEYRTEDLVRLDVKINGELAEPLATICHRCACFLRVLCMLCVLCGRSVQLGLGRGCSRTQWSARVTGLTRLCTTVYRVVVLRPVLQVCAGVVCAAGGGHAPRADRFSLMYSLAHYLAVHVRCVCCHSEKVYVSRGGTLRDVGEGGRCCCGC